MEPGTRFCPNHPGLKFPAYAQECTVCNRTLDTQPGGKVAEMIILDEMAVEQPRPFKEFREKIEAKIKAKVEAKKGKK